MDDLLREAIADAKAVRETALENAKIALEEAFTPRLQSMLSKKIAAEVEDNDEEMEDEDEVRHEEMDSDEVRHDAEEEMDDSDEMRHDKDEMAHDKEEEMEDEDEVRHEGEDKDEVEDEDEDHAMEGAHDKDEVEDEDEVRHEAMEDEDEMAHDKEEEDELDLESVLAELEADLNEEEDEDKDEVRHESEDKDEEEKVDENDVSSDIGKADNKVNVKAGDSSAVGQGPEGEGKDEPAGNELDDHDVVKEEEDKDEEDLDLDEVLKALTEEEDAEEEADKVEELKKEITETRNVVKFMRAKLNEVNLLNAKLLFSNKLFRAFGLNNNQKLKVVENFDRTKNLREVKLVYATLAESFKKPSKLSESVSKGSSSKPVASTKPANEEVLTEGQELKARFKKLANILQETKKNE